jgi:hypothetical protein
VLGITSARLKPSDGHDTAPQNVNFAVRASVLKLFLQSRGVPFQSVDGAPAAASTADLAEMVSRSVVQILCHGATETAPTARNEPTPSPQYAPTARPFKSIESYDVIGFDYGTLRDVSEMQCRTACNADQQCRAFTYNRSARFCFLKNDALILIRNKDAFASVAEELSSKVVFSSMAVTAGLDMPGGDYARMKTSFVGCYLACERDSSCRAFTFVRHKNTCWLKSQIGMVKSHAG